eukprot:scaffold9272_cov195-Amphora_coffeaeformis.AAC.1
MIQTGLRSVLNSQAVWARSLPQRQSQRWASFVSTRLGGSTSSLSSSSSSLLCCNTNSNHRQPSTQQPSQPAMTIRQYHTTERREILPILAVGGLLVIARYSYRAMNRLEEEWEDYQWQLQKYERKHGAIDASVHSIQTLAIDLGTVYSKIASSHVGTTAGKAEVVVSREGDRYFFNGVVLEDEEHAVLGRKALERFFFPEGEQVVSSVKLPWAGLLTDDPNVGDLVSKVISPVLQETLERLECKQEATRFVVTVPCLLAHTNGFQAAFQSLASESSTSFVPDAVAAVWGAQTKGLIPMDEDGKANKILVVDVGGYLTQLSIVEKDRLQSSLVFPWGGETLVEKAVGVLKEQAPAPIADERALSVLQVQARTAVSELATKMQVPVHAHYIFATPGKHHLDTTLSRSVLEQAVQSEISELATTDDMGSLSKHMPTPTNLEMLFLSMVTELLERNNEIPQKVDKILLVGGASRFPL